MIVYTPLWATLKRKGFSTYTLRVKFQISGSTVQRLRKNMSVSTNTLDDLCKLLDCSLADVAELCEVLGLDPLSVANEGAAVLVVSQGDCSKVLDNLRQNPFGKNAAVIGSVSESGRVALKTEIGGTRYVDMPPGELLPRIC